MVKVKVKWTKNTYEVDVDPSDSVNTFRAQLFTLTGVPVERQKLMSKLWKGMLKDDVSLASVNFTDGAQIMLMGSADVIVQPQQKAVFVEDLPTEEVAKTGHHLPAGLNNLGNTCYMNATLECLRKVPELVTGLSSNGGSYGPDQDTNLVVSLNETFRQVNSSVEPISPMMFLKTLRDAFPQFAQVNRGVYMQQDSDEFLQVLFMSLSRKLQAKGDYAGAKNLMDALFGLEFEDTYKCTETDAEPEVKKSSETFKLVCNISNTTNHLAEGVKLNLNGTVEKQSDILNRNAIWQKTSRINKLPRYLCVQFLRFFWKATPDSSDHAGVKCKMLRPISFPLTLDVFEFCSDELRAILKVPRDKHAQEILAELGKKTGAQDAVEESKDDDAEMEDLDPEEKAALEAAKALSVGVTRTAGPGISSDFKGNYELFAVVTHKGRSADSGHYMGWVRQEGDDWLCFDDDQVSECKSEDIQKLKGGGDWHMAYLAFYRYKD